ncbi:VOC family protein [Bacillus gobiensis]|uniref:VOC family protein n=1 Tax=Bacillus gobiensis TaxID=1441095 RepID=UPI003D1B05A7
MTTVQWDHIVHYVNDLDDAIQTFNENGLTAFKGGSHTEWGTYNALSYFGLTYIEFLGVEDRETAINADVPNLVVKDAVAALPEQEVLSRVAIRTDDIQTIAASLRSHGLELSPIMDGKRVDTNGRLIEWKMMTIDGNFQELVYPFVIQWKDTDADRLANLNDSGIIQPHPAGHVEIQSAVFNVTDPVSAALHWQALFGLSVVESDAASVTLGIGEQTFIFKQGNANQFSKVIFQSEANHLIGKTINIGDGEYVFQK